MTDKISDLLPEIAIIREIMAPQFSPVIYLADVIQRAVAEERERCAKIAAQRAEHWKMVGEGVCSMPLEEECEDIAAAIRKGE